MAIGAKVGDNDGVREGRETEVGVRVNSPVIGINSKKPPEETGDSSSVSSAMEGLRVGEKTGVGKDLSTSACAGNRVVTVTVRLEKTTERLRTTIPRTTNHSRLDRRNKRKRV